MPAKERVAALRELMKKHGIAAYLVPSSDPHQNEYVPDCWQRRRWLSGFTGSAGELIVTADEAGQEGDALGVDSHVISVDRAKTLEQVLKLVGARIELIEENLVDVLWEDRPSPSEEQIQLLPKKYAGETTASKLRRLRKEMKREKAAAHVLTTLDAVAWLCNIRGRDIIYNPVDPLHFVHDPVGNSCEQIMRQTRPICSHEILCADST